ncbi:MAG: 23S rRNA (adenine(2503)-C(2))-methyltransferase RlmN [Deltaproteobacteria bacterium]|jgi:23S rRNA (adenine2503-C2)-methyltransferase|nr:23S rRNA (adenine(2503)-C(2))-methyltransferase RlmN [Deltaproteobacteria bacterium]
MSEEFMSVIRRPARKTANETATNEAATNGAATDGAAESPSPGRPVMAIPAPTQKKIRLMDLRPDQIIALMGMLNEKTYRGAQLNHWLFNRGVRTFDEMTDISKKSRDYLGETVTPESTLRLEKDEAEPYGARRFLWRLEDDLFVESVLIRQTGHLTLCVSSQVGCRMGCRFCRTGTLGFTRNLTQGEIVEQLICARKIVPKKDMKITNVVFMGMGEPFDNAENVTNAFQIMVSPQYQAIPRRGVTISTVGMTEELKRFAEDPTLRCRLTVSLGAANDELRSELMPSNLKWPLDKIKRTIAAYQKLPSNTSSSWMTFAYVLLGGVNDSPKHAKELSRFMTGIKSKVNLIPFNPWPGAPFDRPSPQAIEAFRGVLVDKNHTAMIRETKGASINAACGLLVANQLDQAKPPEGPLGASL